MVSLPWKEDGVKYTVLWNYRHVLHINPFSAEIDFRRQNLTSTDVRFCRIKSFAAL